MSFSWWFLYAIISGASVVAVLFLPRWQGEWCGWQCVIACKLWLQFLCTLWSLLIGYLHLLNPSSCWEGCSKCCWPSKTDHKYIYRKWSHVLHCHQITSSTAAIVKLQLLWSYRNFGARKRYVGSISAISIIICLRHAIWNLLYVAGYIRVIVKCNLIFH